MILNQNLLLSHKVIIEEFEEKLIACHNKAVDDEAGFQRVAKASQKAGARKSKQKINAGRMLSHLLIDGIMYNLLLIAIVPSWLFEYAFNIYK